MTTTYPGSLYNIPADKTNETLTRVDHPAHHNDIADTVNSIQTVLGTNPQAGHQNIGQRINSRAVNLADYGTGDGVTDNYAVLNFLIQGMPANGGIIIVPEQTFAIDCTNPIEIGNKHVVIIGAGKGAKLLAQNENDNGHMRMFDMSGNGSIRLENLSIQGPTVLGTTDGWFDVLYADGPSGFAHILRCSFSKMTTAIRVSTSSAWQGEIFLETSEFDGYGGTGRQTSMPVLLAGTGATGGRNKKFTAINSTFRMFGDSADALDHAMYISSDWDFNISNNRFESSVGGGYAVQVFDASVAHGNQGRNQRVFGNTFGSALTCRGIAVAGRSEMIIAENDFEQPHGSIRFNGGSAQVVNNKFMGTVASGTHIDTLAQSNDLIPTVIEGNQFIGGATKMISISRPGPYTIQNNQFRSKAGDGTSYFIDMETPGSPHVKIRDNDFSGPVGSDAIRVGPATAKIVGNDFDTEASSCIRLNNAGAIARIVGNNFNQIVGESVTNTVTPTFYEVMNNTGKSVQNQLIASATVLPIPQAGDLFQITGTTTITSATAGAAGRVIRLRFDSALTFTSANNLRLAGNFITTQYDIITLVSDGTNWLEVSRSVNA